MTDLVGNTEDRFPLVAAHNDNASLERGTYDSIDLRIDKKKYRSSWVHTADQINSIVSIVKSSRPSSIKGLNTTFTRALLEHTR